MGRRGGLNAGLLFVGDELTSGKVSDKNLPYLAPKLKNLGFNIESVIYCRDNIESIKNSIKTLLRSCHVIIISGGLGPTRDDLTREAFASFFNLDLLSIKELEEDIKSFFSKMRRRMPQENLKQAKIPSGANFLKNPIGTAPGFWFKRDEKYIFAFPGVPKEFGHFVDAYLLPILKDEFKIQKIYQKTIKLFGIGESTVEEKIKDILASFPNLGFSVLAKPEYGEIHITFSSLGEDEKKLLHSISKEVENRLSKYIFGYNDDRFEKTCLAPVAKLGLKSSFLHIGFGLSPGVLANNVENFCGVYLTFPDIDRFKKNKLFFSSNKCELSQDELLIFSAKRMMELFSSDISLATLGLLPKKGDPHFRAHICITDGKRKRITSYSWPSSYLYAETMLPRVALRDMKRFIETGGFNDTL